MLQTEPQVTVLPPELLAFTPVAGWALIKPDAKINKTTGGVLLPDGTEDVNVLRTGVVVAAGEGVRLDNGERADVPCKAGDGVLFTAYNTPLVHIEGEQHYVARFTSILGLAQCAKARTIKTNADNGTIAIPQTEIIRPVR